MTKHWTVGRGGALLFVLLILFGVWLVISAAAQYRRDRLWTLVEACLEQPPVAAGKHCPAPRADQVADSDPACVTTTQIWGRTPEYVAIRDLKMCGCPAGFVHGLALPLARISGVEAPHLPEGIWKFAWDVARQRIPAEEAIALVVNSQAQRTQDQLHVHIVQLRANARTRFIDTVAVPNLERIWATAKTAATRRRLHDYGILVARDAAGKDFTVLVNPGDQRDSPEMQLTQSSCR